MLFQTDLSNQLINNIINNSNAYKTIYTIITHNNSNYKYKLPEVGDIYEYKHNKDDFYNYIILDEINRDNNLKDLSK